MRVFKHRKKYMAKKTEYLTALEIKFLEIKDKRYEVADIPGLFLRINPNGTKIWRINKSINGKRVVKTLGNYPEISINQARQLLEKEVKRADIFDENNTLNAVYADWANIKKASIAPESFKGLDSRFRRFILPVLGDMVMDEITPLIVINLLKSNSAIKPYVVKLLCYELKAVETFAVNTGRATALKLGGITQAFPPLKKEHYPTIRPEELKDALKIVSKEIIHRSRQPVYCEVYFAILQTAFYSLCRPIEVCSLRWDWIDFENKTITIPPERMKKRREHIVPMSPQLERLLQALTPVSDEVFTGYIRGDALTVRASLTITLLKRKYTHDMSHLFSLHGIRAIGRTWMAEQGIDPEVAEHCLAHIIDNSTVQAYKRTTLLEKRRVAMNKWCNFVEGAFKETIPDRYFV